MNNSSNRIDTNLTGMWVSFFTAAGIPSDVSATYALTFAENRIQTDMLLDLNKEYLKDMGIVRMGDVIAILRHAKQVHESAARDKVLGSAGGAARVPVAAVTGRATLAQPSSPASRIVEHYTRNPPSPETVAASAVKLKRKTSADLGTTPDLNIKKSRLIRFESPTRVVPPKENVSSKQTVFSRLGSAEPARAPPSAAPGAAAKQIYLRLGSKGDGQPAPVAPPAILAKPSPPTPVAPPAPAIQKDALKYEGILKASPPPRKEVTVTKKVFTVTAGGERGRRIAVATMRADEAPVSARDKLALPRAKSVKFSSRVQYKEIEAAPAPPPRLAPRPTPVFNKPGRRLSMPDAPAGVKARLGTKTVQNFTITKNVFNRLGA